MSGTLATSPEPSVSALASRDSQSNVQTAACYCFHTAHVKDLHVGVCACAQHFQQMKIRKGFGRSSFTTHTTDETNVVKVSHYMMVADMNS